MSEGNFPPGFVRDTLRAVAFLSRLPIPSAVFTDPDAEERESGLAKIAGAFAAAGLVVALPAALLAALLDAFGVDAPLTGFMAVALLTAVAGALHEDGLADTADGFGGGADRERALDIMKDSRIGTYGAIALVFSLVFRGLALAALARQLSPLALAASLAAAASFSRGLMVWHWRALPSARANGLADRAGQPEGRETLTAVATGAAIVLALCLPVFSPSAAAAALVAAFVATLLFNRLCMKKIGGHTGDTLGAAQQIGETVLLVTLAGSL